jgi:hypothetical protein
MEWLNPDTWKPATDLATDWKTLSGVAFGIGTALWRWGGRLWRWLVSKLRHEKPAAAPTGDAPLIFVVEELCTVHGPLGAGDKTGTRVQGVFDITNDADRNLILLKVRLGNHTAYLPGLVGVRTKDSYAAKRAIPAHQMSSAMIELTFMPAIHRAGEDLIADVIFTDNYNGEHIVPSVRFRPSGPLMAPMMIATSRRIEGT